jgi:carboxypeptidase C (cathepsin A)
MYPLRALLLTLLLALPAWPAAAEESEAAKSKEEEAEVPEASLAVTRHEARIGGRTVRYTASAGTMLMENSKRKPVALFGYTAYVDDSADKSSRPLLFAYNGGPGSASLWLHMGVLGPQRAAAPDGGFGSNGPFKRVDNEYSIIDKADLVMLDPVGTGFARPVGKGKGKDFWGVDQDIKSVSEFIVKYVTETGRWASPKYILGESYGGMRSGGVALHLLDEHMLALNGVVLVSPFMEMSTGFAGLGIDLPHVMYLPTFAATAWYQDQLTDKPADFSAFISEVETFALQEYAPALLQGSRLSGSQRAEILRRLSRYTGLDEEYWDRADLRIDEGRFTQELMRRSGKTTGRIDSRFLGDMINRLGESASYDPMTTAIGPAYLAAFMDYYRKDLEVTESGEYVVFGDVFRDWDWSHKQPDLSGFELPFPNTNVDLAHAMKKNPSMQILVQQGYFDLATPFLATKYYIDHLDITPELRRNITLEMYDAGHMMYVHEPSLLKFRQDLAGFIDRTH